MPNRPSHAWIDGRTVPFADAKVPIDDRGLQFGESLYEVVPITAGRPRLLPEHVARMQRAAPLLGLEAGVPHLAEWERLVCELLVRAPVVEGLLYAQVTGGAAPREHVPSAAPKPTFFAYVTPFRFPRDAEVLRGVRAVALPDIRWGRRDLKTTMLLPAVLAKREARRREADEALLVGNQGYVNEGASSNVFIVEGKALVTPEQSSDLLPGTMRPAVIEVAREAGFEVASAPISIERLRAADEVFVTSSSQLVMPVLFVDGRPVKDGRAGPVARELARRLRVQFALEADALPV
jgi:D-alanine transaminase